MMVILLLTRLLQEGRLRVLGAYVGELRRCRRRCLREEDSVNLTLQVADLKVLLLQLELVLGFEIPVPLVQFGELRCHLLNSFIGRVFVHLKSLAPLRKLLAFALVVQKAGLQVAQLLLLLP